MIEDRMLCYCHFSYAETPKNYSICLSGQNFLDTMYIMKTNQVLKSFSTTTEKTIC